MGNVATATGVRIRQARIDAGLTQQVLATRAGLATKTVSRIENGEDTTLGTIEAIAAALGIDTYDLLAA